MPSQLSCCTLFLRSRLKRFHLKGGNHTAYRNYGVEITGSCLRGDQPHHDFLGWEKLNLIVFVVIQSLSHIQLFVIQWTAAHQTSLSFSISQSLLNSFPLSQWCYPTISSPSPPVLNLSHHQGLFQWVGSSHQVAKVLELELELQHQSFQWTFRTDFL